MARTIQVGPNRDQCHFVNNRILEAEWVNHNGNKEVFRFTPCDPDLFLPEDIQAAWLDFFWQAMVMLGKWWQIEAAFAEYEIEGRFSVEEIQ